MSTGSNAFWRAPSVRLGSRLVIECIEAYRPPPRIGRRIDGLKAPKRQFSPNGDKRLHLKTSEVVKLFSST